MLHPDPEVGPRLDCILEDGDPPLEVVPLAGDASTRSYFRASYSDGRTAIIMLQPHAGLNEEASFLDVHGFLENLGVPVPLIYRHYSRSSLIVLEDLGDELLETAVSYGDADLVRRLYREAVEILVRMRRVTAPLSSGCGAFDLAFDEEKLMQEMRFFQTHFIEGLCGKRPSRRASASLERFFLTICRLLAAEPRVFTHRDYHSRNLIRHRDRLVMIDFQDARMGPAQYDLASLLRDSYVSLPGDLFDELLNFYMDETGTASSESRERFRYVFDVMSLQRNIKALGTFGYQLSVRKAERYLSSIPRTGSYVALNIAAHEQFAEFTAVVEDFVCKPALELG